MNGVRWSLLALLALAGCADGLALSVDVKTDFVPGPEFSAVRVTLVGEGETNTVGAAGDYLDGQRAVDFGDLEANAARVVSVELLDDLGAVVAERSALVDHRVDRGITLTLARDCAGVMCPGAGAAAATACFGGRCTEPECIDGTEPSCPEPECIVDTDCPTLDMCSTRRCIDTLCLYAPTVGACGSGTYCSPEMGCIAIPLPVDASMDAAPMSDAGPDVLDVPAVPPSVPQLLWPQNGLATGSAVAATFHWTPVAGAESYDVEFRDECDVDMSVPCTSLPSVTVMRESEPLRFSLRMMPAGRRYRWRVRACRSSEDCGEWSGERYLDVGRGPSDFDGDGVDELLVGSTGHVTRFGFNGGAFGVTQELPSPFSDMTSGYGLSSYFGDIDGDGFIDAAIGAQFDRGFGSVALYRGSATGLVFTQSIENPPTSDINNYFGEELCIADFNADGYADLAVESISGTFVYAGSDAGIEPALVVEFSDRLRSCADINEDGYADIIVGDAFYPGHPTALVEDTSVMLPGRVSYYVGDVNADGLADFAAGGINSAAFAYGNVGGVDGPVPLMGIAGGIYSFDYQALGFADIDNDGFSDLVMGDVQSDARSPGIVAFSRGSLSGVGLRVGVNVACDNACSRRGYAVTYGFDLNDDGFGDAAISAGGEEGVFVFFGSASGLVSAAVRIPRSQPSFELFGASL